MRRALAVFAAVLLSMAASAHAAIQDTIHRSFNVADGGRLTLDAGFGEVTIVSGGAGVSIDIFREAKTNSRSRAAEIFRDHELSFEQHGNDVVIRSRYEKVGNWLFSITPLRLRFSVRVPQHYNLDVTTSGGDIDAGDLTGEVVCRTSGGHVKVGRVAGPVNVRTSGGDLTIGGAASLQAHTSGGSIEVDSVAGSADVHTSGGSISIRRAAGNVAARSSGGGIHIGEAGGIIEATTSGGSIEAMFTQQPRGDSRLSISGGGVTVTLARNIAVDVDAHSSGGGIDSDVPVTVTGSQSGSSLFGKINGGGPRLVLRSSGGGIRLRAL